MTRSTARLRTTRVALSDALALAALVAAARSAAEEPPAAASATPPELVYIDTSFENASPLWWETDGAGRIHLHLVYDHERASPNRANGHFHFRLEARRGAELTLVLHNFDNIWNGRPGLALDDRTPCLASPDGRRWEHLATSLVDEPSGKCLQVRVRMREAAMYLAGVEPYTSRDLAALLAGIRAHPDVSIEPIGKTVEGRELEMVHVGKRDAGRHILIRARSHPWEAGGSWAVDGLVRRVLGADARAAELREALCFHILPMANKDGVVRGRTRFNLRGMDLNRNWDRPADPELAPENHALERWLDEAILAGRRPALALDLHNDQGGGLHLSRPEGDLMAYLEGMKRLEEHLRRRTWFTEGSSGAGFRNPGTIGEGLLVRHGIPAAVLELNANWIAGRGKAPGSADWQEFGGGLAEAIGDWAR